jgi:hypothetical protein
MVMPLPQPTDAFQWTQEPWGAALRCAPLAAAAEHLFTGRDLTLRDAPGEWTAVAASMGVEVGDLLLVRQVHEASVAVASADRARPWRPPDADVIITDDRDAAIGVRVADCVPILLAEDSGRAVGAVHAGWRGMARRAPLAGVMALQRHYGVRPQRMIAAIGPCIGPCCYEVGENTRDAFRDAGHHAALIDRWFAPQPSGRLHLDLWRAARDQLEGAGLLPDHIYAADLCTKTHAAVLHSFRAAGETVGRMVAAIRVRAPLRPSRD